MSQRVWTANSNKISEEQERFEVLLSSMSRNLCSKPHQAHFPLNVNTVTPQLSQHCVRLTQIMSSN